MVMTRVRLYKDIIMLRPRAYVHPLEFLTGGVIRVKYRGLTGEQNRSLQLV